MRNGKSRARNRVRQVSQRHGRTPAALNRKSRTDRRLERRMLEAWHAGQLMGAVLIGFLRAKSRRKARKPARGNTCLACFAGLGKKAPSFGRAACRDTIILRSTHA